MITNALSTAILVTGLLGCGQAPQSLSQSKSPSTPTTLQTMLERRGDMTVKEFHPVGTLSGQFDSKAKLDAVVVTAPWDSTKTFGLRIEVGADGETETGVLDNDEAIALLRASDYIIAKAPAMARDSLDYTEVTYTSRAGVEIGFYQTGRQQTAYVKANQTRRGMLFFDTSKLSALRVIVASGVQRLSQLSGKPAAGRPLTQYPDTSK